MKKIAVALFLTACFNYSCYAGNPHKTELVNVAQFKPITVSSRTTQGGNLLDDDITTAWNGSRSTAIKQSLEIDMLRRYNIEKIEIYDSVNNTLTANCSFFRIIASNFSDFLSYDILGEVQVYDSNIFPLKGKLEVVLPLKKSYRYVRVEKLDNTAFTLAEIKIFAKQTMTEVSRNKPAIASSSYSASYNPQKANNGTNTSSSDCWISGVNSDYHYWQVDLEAAYPIGTIEIEDRKDNSDSSTRNSISVYGSNQPIQDSAKTTSGLSSGYTQLTRLANPTVYNGYYPFPAQNLGYYQATTNDTTPYRYIIYKKTYANNGAIGGFRAFVINPIINEITAMGNYITLEFSDEMDISTLNNSTIKLYKGETEIPYSFSEKNSYSCEILVPTMEYEQEYELFLDGVKNEKGVYTIPDYSKAFTSVSGRPEFKSEDNISSFLNGSTVNFKVDVTNHNFTNSLNTNLILCLYNGNRLEKIAIDTKNIPVGSAALLSADLEIPDIDLDGYSVKSFLWQDFGSLSPISEGLPASPSNLNWFSQGKYGIFVHYLYGIQNNPDRAASQGQGTSWNECVEDFDVVTFSENAAEAGAAYVIFTTQQTDKYMIAPNLKYTEYTGYQTGQATSERDLILDLASALNEKNIKLFLYVTGDGPHNDPAAAEGLGWDGTANDTFISRWGEVIEEYSQRYGSLVSGWWTDGCYSRFEYNDAKISELASRQKSGNHNAIVAFNKGVEPIGQIYYQADDYFSGERNSLDQIPVKRMYNGRQWHILSPLGSGWGDSGCAYTALWLTAYAESVFSHGGVITFDVAVNRDGTIPIAQINQLKLLNPK